MSENKCYANHKFGPFQKEENYYFRECQCCGKISKYPKDKQLNEEIKKQDDASNLLSVLIDNNIDVLNSSDDFIGLIANLYNYLFYLYINEETQNKFIDKLDVFNQYFNANDLDRFRLVENFAKYVSLHFKKNNYEIKHGENSFPESESIEIDRFSVGINDNLNQILEEIYNSTYEQKPKPNIL